MTKEERQEAMAKARSAKKLNKVETSDEVVVEDEVITVGAVQYAEQEYGEFVIVTEPHDKGARVIVLQDGKHSAEWHGNLFDCMEKAQKFADTGDMTGSVNVDANA